MINKPIERVLNRWQIFHYVGRDWIAESGYELVFGIVNVKKIKEEGIAWRKGENYKGFIIKIGMRFPYNITFCGRKCRHFRLWLPSMRFSLNG